MVEILALTELSELSTLEDEFERLKLDAMFVATAVLAELSEASTLEEELDKFTLDV